MQAGREIRFRAWVKKENRMEHCVDVNPFYIGDGDRNRWKRAEVDLMQFTGLRDKNGKEIYEGDILKFRHSSEPEYNLDATVVEWVPQWCRFCIDGNSGLNGNMNLEVIGNIYENPDLLSDI